MREALAGSLDSCFLMKRALEEAREAIREWLQRERHLQLNPRHDAVEPTEQPSTTGAPSASTPTAQPGTFLGYRVSRSGLLPGPKAKRRLRQRLRQIDALGPERLARGLRAYRGVLLTLG